MNFNKLKKYGFSPRFEQESTIYQGFFPARVSEQHRDLYKVISESGELTATVSGKLAFQAKSPADFPAVGDFVMIDRMDDREGNAVIHEILRRKSELSRKAAGTSNNIQVLAANIDTVFICMSCNADFNLRRLERYLSLAWDSMATPVILLTKADLCDHIDELYADAEKVGLGTDIILCSSLEKSGYQKVLPYIQNGNTVVFIGSSGVGKSTLINRLMGEEVLQTKEIRDDDDKGRHTTTHRQLLLLPGGGIVIDTPGMRELQMESGNLCKSFEDIELLSFKCRFKDCSHSSEPGCAVRNAIETGELAQSRFENYKKLKKELGYEGLSSRQLEHKKIENMFGSMGEMKQVMKQFKNRNKKR